MYTFFAVVKSLMYHFAMADLQLYVQMFLRNKTTKSSCSNVDSIVFISKRMHGMHNINTMLLSIINVHSSVL